MSNYLDKVIRFPVLDNPVTDRDGRTARCTHLEVRCSYLLGGYSFFSGQEVERGYYISVRPIEIGNGIISETLGYGYKYLLIPCKRQSAKKEAEAGRKVEEMAEKFARDYYPTARIDFSQKSVA